MNTHLTIIPAWHMACNNRKIELPLIFHSDRAKVKPKTNQIKMYLVGGIPIKIYTLPYTSIYLKRID